MASFDAVCGYAVFRATELGITSAPARAPISLLNENNKGFRSDAVIFYRRSAGFTLHDRLERVHVGDVHRQSDAIGSIRLNELADVLRHSTEHLFTLLR